MSNLTEACGFLYSQLTKKQLGSAKQIIMPEAMKEKCNRDYAMECVGISIA